MNAYVFVLPVVVALGRSAAWAQTVKLTPLGSHTGESCDRDRATIFEDPTGVRILYDAGHSVTGAEDPRLGDVDVVLLGHAHGDHRGDRKMKALDDGVRRQRQVRGRLLIADAPAVSRTDAQAAGLMRSR
jgi:hypothetical protein